MKNIITQLFVTLGVIFLLVLFVGTYLFITDPYELKPLIFGQPAPMQSESTSAVSPSSDVDTSTAVVESDTAGFQLSSAQVEALVSLGIDPSSVPSSISPEQEACFVGALGEAQVAEIKAGAVPSAIEFAKASSCI